VRYYKIVIGSGGSALTFDSTNDPNALDVEIDIFAFNYATAAGGGMDVKSFVRIYGVPLSVVSQAQNLNGQPVAIYGGMQKGLPLATAAANQAGLLAKGTIYPAVGNWIGTDTTLDLILAPPSGTNYKPVNIASPWKAGQNLADVLQAALSTAFPSATLKINISNKLTLQNDQPFVYGTLQQIAQFARSISQKILGTSNYLGVQISQNGDTISVYDGTAAAPAGKPIAFQDMIGQPTWLGFTSNFKTVMRADISVSDLITMPKAIQVVTPQAALLPRNTVSFAGNYRVQQVRHVGRFRQPDAASWCTVFDVASNPGGSSTTQIGGAQSNFQ